MAITAVSSLFEWLVKASYLAANPWHLVNTKLGDDAQQSDDVTTRAFTPTAWAEILRYLQVAPPSPSIARLSWLCIFVESTGLRSAELIQAIRGHLSLTPDGWVIRVFGKGRKRRTVPVPKRAIDETRRYFASRGLDFDTAPADAPLLAALSDGMTSISYRAMYETFTRFVKRALAKAAPEVREQAIAASNHWLRHTHATRAAERKVPLDVLQENLGQSDPRTTAHYYRAQIERRQKEMERAFAQD